MMFSRLNKNTFSHICATAALILCSQSTLAVNGAFDFGFSEITRGMAGSGAALPQDTLIAALNPAGMAYIGKQMDIGAAIYFPDMHYTASSVTPPVTPPPGIIISPGKHKSDTSLFFLPDFGYNTKINDKSTLGFSLYSLGGFGAEYKGGAATTFPPATSRPGPLGGGNLKSDLKQAVASITYARKFWHNQASFGVSLLMGIQALTVSGLSALGDAGLSNNRTHMTNKGTNFSVGAGVRIGMIFHPLSKIAISIAYQPKIYMSRLSDYAGLLPNNGQFDMPAYGNIGIAIHVTPNVVFTGDVQKIWYKDVKAYGNNNNALVNGTCILSDRSTCLGGNNGAGFGWDNALIVKVGAQWKINPVWTVRAGYNHGNDVLPNNQGETNIITPGAVVQDLYTLGATRSISKKDALNAFLVFIPEQSKTAVNRYSYSAGQTTTASTSGIGFGLSWTRKFV